MTKKKLRNCPNCKNWEFDDQSHWCKKDFYRLTYTSITLPRKEENIGECYDYDPIDANYDEGPKKRERERKRRLKNIR